MKSNKEKGVTLIALAITVIVILILAGISIGTLKNDGTLDKTQSSSKIETAAEEENVIRLAYTQMEMNEGIANSNLTLDSFKTYMSKHTKEYYIDENVTEEEKTKAIATTENATKFVKVIFENTGNSYIIGLSEETEKPTYDYYVITYIANSGTNAPNEQYNRVGYPTNITSQEPTKTGFDFLGWSLASTSKEISYTPGSTYSDGINITLYAVWKDSTPPIIDLVTATSSSITIQAHDNETGISGYAISKTPDMPTSFNTITNNTSITQTISNLPQSTTYYIWVKNGENMMSEVKVVKTETIPDVSLSADKTTWTNGNVIVTASTSTREYTLQTSTNGTTWGTTNPITFTQNGTMYARLIDSTGQTGKHASYVVKNIDKTPPSSKISVNNEYKKGIYNVTLTATGQDNASGVSEYQFYIDGVLKNTVKTSIGTAEYKYSESMSQSKKCYVIVKDAATNPTKSAEAPITKIEIGDYIDYSPDSTAQTTYSKSKLTKSITGSSNNGVDFKRNSLKWKVLRIYSNGSMDLIGDTTSEILYLRGASGYNNGVYIMNDICKTLYSRSGITARSVNYEDFDKWLTTAGKSARDNYKNEGTQYGKTKTYTSNLYYPDLYRYEKGAGISSGSVGSGTLEKSQTYSGYSGGITYNTSNTASGKLTITETYWDTDLNSTNFGDGAKALRNRPSYWVASRNVACLNINVHFGLRNGGIYLYGNGLYFSHNAEDELDYPVRPVVQISGTSVKTSDNATSSSGVAHHINQY